MVDKIARLKYLDNSFEILENGFVILLDEFRSTLWDKVCNAVVGSSQSLVEKLIDILVLRIILFCLLCRKNGLRKECYLADLRVEVLNNHL